MAQATPKARKRAPPPKSAAKLRGGVGFDPFAADGGQRSRQRQIIQIMSRGLRKRTRLSPTGHAAVDQPGISLERYIRAKAEALHGAGPKSFDQCVGLADQLEGERNSVGLFHIDRHRGA